MNWLGRLLWVVLGAATFLAGGVVFATRASPIQPLDRLPGGLSAGPSIEAISSTSAMITLKTSTPAFCQVNAGPTTQYGGMYRMSMTGPMTDHRITLPGLHPDTVYHVRLTALDVQARVYQSPDLTFKTRPAAAGRPKGRNVAALQAGARVVGVSSNYGGGGIGSTYGANHAIDGDPSTEWSSNGDGDKAWIEIELAQRFHISEIGFWTRTMGATAQIRRFEVVADGKTHLGPFTLPDATGVHYFPVDVTAKRLRFTVLESSGGNTGAVEIEALTAP